MALFNLFRKPRPQPTEPSLDGIELSLREIPGAVTLIDNLPRVHWPAVHDAVAPYREHPAIHPLWTEMAAQWLGVLRDHLGDPYQLYESKHLLLLSAQGPGIANRLGTLGDAAYERLERLLRGSDEERGFGKHAALVLADRSTYYDYISYFFSGREQPYGASSGMHISRGYRHTVINAQSKQVERTLIHELTHDMVGGRRLPRWVNEGLAQFAEDLVPGYRPPLIDARGVRLHRRYWSWFGLDHFWEGGSFLRVSSQHLSYQLAEVLFRNMANHRSRGKRLPEFLARARRDDAGPAACAECFGCPLPALIEEFLGPGPWDLRPRKNATEGT